MTRKLLFYYSKFIYETLVHQERSSRISIFLIQDTFSQLFEPDGPDSVFGIGYQCNFYNLKIRDKINPLSYIRWRCQTSLTGSNPYFQNDTYLLSINSLVSLYLKPFITLTQCWGSAQKVSYNYTPKPFEPTVMNEARCGPEQIVFQTSVGPHGHLVCWHATASGGSPISCWRHL